MRCRPSWCRFIFVLDPIGTGLSLTFPDIVDDWVGGMVAARVIGLLMLSAVVFYEYRASRPTVPLQSA
ncbi:hypothetical protein BH11PSE3_BH11PSE3_46590 [soil metagenome]